MKRISAALVLCAACAPPLIPAGEKPAWVSTPNGDLRFPPDRFIAAVGSLPVTQKPTPELLASLDDAARAAVQSIVAASVANELNAAQLRQKPAAADLLRKLDAPAACSIEGRWRAGDTAYAWAVFDKGKAADAQLAAAEQHQKAAQDLLAQGDAAEGAPGDALRFYAHAHTEAVASAASALSARALGVKTEVSPVMAQAEEKVGSLLESLSLTVVEGDRQRASEGKPLPQPIVFTAWLKGKKAAGLPMAVSVPGGRAAAVTVGPDGRGEVRVDDAGKFARREQSIGIALDWPVLLGVDASAVPAWITSQQAAGTVATAVKKGVDTTRVLVLVHEKIDGGFPVTHPPLAAALAAALRKAGFDVQDGEALMKKFGAERVSRMTDAQVRDAARRVADVVVIGTAVSRFDSNPSAASMAYKAKAEIRALEVGSGQVVYTAPPDEVKSKKAGEPSTAGRSALQALADVIAPSLQAALVQAESQ
jgi:hypothetical protein